MIEVSLIIVVILTAILLRRELRYRRLHRNLKGYAAGGPMPDRPRFYLIGDDGPEIYTPAQAVPVQKDSPDANLS